MAQHQQQLYGLLYVVKESVLNTTKQSGIVISTGNYMINFDSTAEHHGTVVNTIRKHLTSLQHGNPRLLFFRYCAGSIPSVEAMQLKKRKLESALNESGDKMDRLAIPFGHSDQPPWWFYLKNLSENEFIAGIEKIFGCTLSNPWLPCTGQ